ncbi:MAG: hypothetical protein ABI779_08495 [Acidobacteriota bacterium]
MRQFLPLTSPLHNFNITGVTYLVIAAAVGLVLGVVVRRRWRARYVAYATYAVAGLAIATVAQHVLCIWILKVDPQRDTGGIPLPAVASYATEISLALLLFPGPVVQGMLLPFIAGRDRGWLLALVTLLVVSYSFWSVPWFGAVVFD